MVIREGRWDCDTCGAKGNLGRQKDCPHCGANRPENVEFYLPEGEPPVSDPDQLRDAQAGPNWICEHCGTHNQGFRVTCKDCGAPRGSSKVNPVVDYSLGEIPRESARSTGKWYEEEEIRQPMTSVTDDLPEVPTAEEEPLSAGIDIQRWFPYAGIAALIAAVIFGAWFLFFRVQDVTVSVSGHSWERVITVEKYKTVREEGWSIPLGGRLVDSRPAIHHYNTVVDHYDTKTRQVPEQVWVRTETYTCGYRSLGNGYFQDIKCTRNVYQTRYRTETYREPVYRSDPVYGVKYTYDIEKWVHERSERTAGNDHEAYWPEMRFADKERESGRSEVYTVFFTDSKEKQYSLKVNLNEWLTYMIGDKYTAEINTVGLITKIKS